jgi:chaperonin cofactor prefoldin
MEYRDYWEDLDLQDFDVEDFLREEQQSEQERLEQELERIEDLLSEREEIHSESVSELESKLDWYVERLENLYRGFGGGQREEKESLKTKIEEFYSELRREKRNQWRDKIELEMELREVERALEEVEDEDSLWRFLE